MVALWNLMRLQFLLCLTALAPLGWSAEPVAAKAVDKVPVTDFIRVSEDEAAARLQTAVTRYQKDGVTVDLIGAIHIADKEYYKNLNQRFDDYDAMLFEMIGGREQDRAAAADEAGKESEEEKHDAGGEVGQDAPGAPGPANLDVLHQMYGLVSRFLALTDQMASIDYSKDHFVHADLSLEEFRRLQSEKGESVIGFALEAGRKAEESGTASQPDMASLMRALMSGNPGSVKLQIVHTLGQGDDQIAAFAGESVIIGERNAKCLEVLDAQVERGKRKLGIFYGAAHFPDMERRLAEQGYKRVKQEWLTAWDIPKSKPVPAGSPSVTPGAGAEG